MDHHHEAFTPENVDQQVDQLLTSSPEPGQEQAPAVQVVQTLQLIYEETARLQRVWERLAPHLSEERTQQEGEETFPDKASDRALPGETTKKMRTDQMHPACQPSFFKRALHLLIASILLIVGVGSLAVVLQRAHEWPGSVGQPPSLPPLGQIVYSAPLSLNQPLLSTPAWSQDSQRLALLGDPTAIWDTTTRKYSLTIPFINPGVEAAPAWSPTSDLLALPGQQGVTIVNGQNGHTVATYKLARSTNSLSFLGAGGPLSAHLSLSGGGEIGGVAWSPDGKAIASCSVSLNLVQIWNPQTGQPEVTLTQPQASQEKGASCENIAWSPDGTYIAATYVTTTNAWSQTVAWKVETQQIVFQQTAAPQQFFITLAWQPGTDNLALAGSQIGNPGAVEGNSPPTPISGAPATNELSIWNVSASRLLQSVPGDVENMAWSPDGKAIVFTSLPDGSTPAMVTILNVTTKQKIYTYRAQHPQIFLSGPAWSPDGRYIALLLMDSAIPWPSSPSPASAAGSGSPLTLQIWQA